MVAILKFSAHNVIARSVYSKSEIEDIFNEHPYSDFYTLSIKLGSGGIPRQSIIVKFKNFNHKKCLKVILKFAALMWKTEYCKPHKMEESKWMKKKKE